MSRIFAIYGAGFVLLFLLFALLYAHAYRKRDSARRSPPLEVFDAKAAAGRTSSALAVGLVAWRRAARAAASGRPSPASCTS